MLFQYIFEGLAHLAARILIMTSNSMETIDQASVQRMCRNAIALQQTLSSITATREVALDNARNFYEMLYMDPEVCVKSIFTSFDEIFVQGENYYWESLTSTFIVFSRNFSLVKYEEIQSKPITS